MGIGPYALAFNESFLKSQDNARRQGQADLQEAMTMEELRQRGELGADIGSLTGAFQARRAALANQPQPTPGAPPAPAGPEQLAGPPPGAALIAEPPGTPGMAPPGMAPSGPGPAGAPADEGPRRKSLLESIDPAMAGRLLRTGAGRSALKDLETAEKEQEQADNRKLAETVFTDATKAMRDGDALGYYDNAAKAMRIMGNHESAAKYLEHAMNLRGDQDEQKKANEDLGRWLKAQSAYTNDPSPDNYNKFMEELGQANSKASRAMRVQIANNVLTKTFDQNPKVASFSRGLASAADNEAAGRDTLLFGHATTVLQMTGYGASHVALGASGYVALGRHVATFTPTVNRLYADGIVKAWAQFLGTTANTPVLGGWNVAGVTDVDTGLWIVRWDTDFADATYAVVVSVGACCAFVTAEDLNAAHVNVRAYNSAGAATDPSGVITVIAIGRQ